jgi:hypothetical protein
MAIYQVYKVLDISFYRFIPLHLATTSSSFTIKLNQFSLENGSFQADRRRALSVRTRAWSTDIKQQL